MWFHQSYSSISYSRSNPPAAATVSLQSLAGSNNTTTISTKTRTKYHHHHHISLRWWCKCFRIVPVYYYYCYLSFLLLLIPSTNSVGGRQWSSRVVNTRLGLVRGFLFLPKGYDGVEVFLALPYASPPVGSLRFMPPVSGKSISITDFSFKKVYQNLDLLMLITLYLLRFTMVRYKNDRETSTCMSTSTAFNR